MDRNEMISIDKFFNRIDIETDACLVCESPVSLNMIHELQCCLEDIHVDFDKFCAISLLSGIPFIVQRGRLRLKQPKRCFNGKDLKSLLEKVDECK